QVVVMNHGKIEQVGTPMQVFDRPASAFVMNFLGNVNVFHGRVHEGQAHLGGLQLACPEYTHYDSQQATVYIRPHELEIGHSANGVPSLKARVTHISPVGSVAKVQLQAKEFDTLIQVDLSPAKYKELELKTGDTVHLFPKQVRIFLPDYCI